MPYLQDNLDRRTFHQWLCGILAVAGCTKTSAFGEVSMLQPPQPLPALDALTLANNSYAMAMLSKLESARIENQFFSPLSIELALCLTMEGARGKTAQEMGEALQFPETLTTSSSDSPWDMSQLRKQIQAFCDWSLPSDSADAESKRKEIAKLRVELKKANLQAENRNPQLADKGASEAKKLADQINELAPQVDQYELQIANSVWVENSFPLSSKYEQLVQQYYGSARATRVDFVGAPDAQREKINDWVSDQTREKITNLLGDGSISSDTRLVLANAIYFKGNWKSPFEPEQTQPLPFRNSSGSETEVPMMQANAYAGAKYAAFNADGSMFTTPKMVNRDFNEEQVYPGVGGFQVIELPYNGDNLSMLICLPRSNDGLTQLITNLTPELLSSISSQLADRKIDIALPKFKLEVTYNLGSLLQELGMESAFRSDADFSGLTEVDEPSERLFISMVMHKAFVDVNEVGTEAAAATAVVMMRTAAPAQIPFVPKFIADHPFLFFIRERTSGLLLFAGRMEQPET